MNNLQRSLSEAERTIAAWIAARHPNMVSPLAVWPICDRPRNDCWSMGRVELMGDACHAVRPFMAAGGSMAIEVSRTITEFADIDGLRELRRYSNSSRRRRPAHLYRHHLDAWPDRERRVLRLRPLSHRLGAA